MSGLARTKSSLEAVADDVTGGEQNDQKQQQLYDHRYKEQSRGRQRMVKKKQRKAMLAKCDSLAMLDSLPLGGRDNVDNKRKMRNKSAVLPTMSVLLDLDTSIEIDINRNKVNKKANRKNKSVAASKNNKLLAAAKAGRKGSKIKPTSKMPRYRNISNDSNNSGMVGALSSLEQLVLEDSDDCNNKEGSNLPPALPPSNRTGKLGQQNRSKNGSNKTGVFPAEASSPLCAKQHKTAKTTNNNTNQKINYLFYHHLIYPK